MTYQPFSDVVLRYDEHTDRYYLTEEAIKANGIDMRSRLSIGYSNVDPSIVIRRHIERVTEMVYNYIHSYAIDNARQDYLISHIPSARNVLYKALLDQSEYVLYNGDMTRSLDKERRALAIDGNTRAVLETYLPELGTNILNMGV